MRKRGSTITDEAYTELETGSLQGNCETVHRK